MINYLQFSWSSDISGNISDFDAFNPLFFFFFFRFFTTMIFLFVVFTLLSPCEANIILLSSAEAATIVLSPGFMLFTFILNGLGGIGGRGGLQSTAGGEFSALACLDFGETVARLMSSDHPKVMGSAYFWLGMLGSIFASYFKAYWASRSGSYWLKSLDASSLFWRIYIQLLNWSIICSKNGISTYFGW